MAQIKFYKYVTAGDDFILIDNRDGAYDQYMNNTKLKRRMCDRNFGIGANSMLELKSHVGFDYELVYHTSAGNAQGVTGNGSRCALAHVASKMESYSLGQKIRYLAADGAHVGMYDSTNKMVTISMKDVHEVIKIGQNGDGFFADSGSPNFVKFVKDKEEVDLLEEGRHISKQKRYLSQKWPVTVNFVEVKHHQLQPRCYDPEKHGELFACGTGSVAIAAAYAAKMEMATGPHTTTVKWRGGPVTVSFNIVGTKYTNIRLSGTIEYVYHGYLDV